MNNEVTTSYEFKVRFRTENLKNLGKNVATFAKVHPKRGHKTQRKVQVLSFNGRTEARCGGDYGGRFSRRCKER